MLLAWLTGFLAAAIPVTAAASDGFDAYLQRRGDRRPAVVVIHGGGFSAGSRVAFVGQLLETLTRAGYNWFSVDYRLGGPDRREESLDDVRATLNLHPRPRGGAAHRPRPHGPRRRGRGRLPGGAARGGEAGRSAGGGAHRGPLRPGALQSHGQRAARRARRSRRRRHGDAARGGAPVLRRPPRGGLPLRRARRPGRHPPLRELAPVAVGLQGGAGGVAARADRPGAARSRALPHPAAEGRRLRPRARPEARRVGPRRTRPLPRRRPRARGRLGSGRQGHLHHAAVRAARARPASRGSRSTTGSPRRSATPTRWTTCAAPWPSCAATRGGSTSIPTGWRWSASRRAARWPRSSPRRIAASRPWSRSTASTISCRSSPTRRPARGSSGCSACARSTTPAATSSAATRRSTTSRRTCRPCSSSTGRTRSSGRRASPCATVSAKWAPRTSSSPWKARRTAWRTGKATRSGRTTRRRWWTG